MLSASQALRDAQAAPLRRALAWADGDLAVKLAAADPRSRIRAKGPHFLLLSALLLLTGADRGEAGP
eukprot:12572991-Alexandrium_andersonii.AAC.1